MPADSVESGSYEYLLNGERTAVREQWRRTRQAGGAWLLFSSRTAPGIELAVEARVDGGVVTACQVTWQGEGQPGISAHYSMHPDHVGFTRRTGTGAGEQRDIAIDPGAPAPLLSPLMRIFVGPVIARLLQQGGEGTVIVPDIRDPLAQAGLLLPLVSERQAKLVTARSALRVDGADVPCSVCEYLGDQYGPGTRFWLDADNLLLRYQWQQAQQHWDVWLRRNHEA